MVIVQETNMWVTAKYYNYFTSTYLQFFCSSIFDVYQKFWSFSFLNMVTQLDFFEVSLCWCWLWISASHLRQEKKPHRGLLMEERTVDLNTRRPQGSLNTPAKRGPCQIGTKWEPSKLFSISVSPWATLQSAFLQKHTRTHTNKRVTLHTHVATEHFTLSLLYITRLNGALLFYFPLVLESFTPFLSSFKAHKEGLWGMHITWNL